MFRGSQRSEVRSQKSEVRSQESEVRGQGSDIPPLGVRGLLVLLLVLLFSCQSEVSQSQSTDTIPILRSNSNELKVGAERLGKYLSLLEGKRVGLVVNQTSMIHQTHLVDTLLSLGITIQKVFAPEHGFRGQADAGETVSDGVDSQTGLPIVSLYGNNKKPTAYQLQDLDIVIFDIQDVGARFYTYISTMHYVMEACAENQKAMLILDRPNPNGDYVDGPMLDMALQSFVGYHAIPIVHGLTVGELAQMIVGENWMATYQNLDLTIIPIENYNHQIPYSLPIKPSPNLPNDLSIRLYPSLCLFEGTAISVGRGTYFPFQVIGYPDASFGNFTFTPESIDGMSKYPKHENQTCYGIDFRKMEEIPTFSLSFIIDYYQKFPNKNEFFNGYFDTLVGTFELKQQIQAGWTEAQIRDSWQEDLENYRLMRERYLLYP